MVPICKKGGNYPRDSIENAALAVAVGVKKTLQTYEQFITKNQRNYNIELWILPKITDKNKGLWTDNAFNVRWDNRDIIAILPHSKEHFEKTKRVLSIERLGSLYPSYKFFKLFF